MVQPFPCGEADPNNGRDFDLYVIQEDGHWRGITFHPDFDAFPMFTSDERRLVWASNRLGKAPARNEYIYCRLDRIGTHGCRSKEDDPLPTKTAKRSKLKPGQRAEETLRVLISHHRIRTRVRQMAEEIRRDFPADPIHLVGVLKGSILFLADLARELGGEVSFDFISVSSYGKGMDSTGEVKMIKDLDVSIEGRCVLVVEDILDTGLTLKYLLRLFEERKPKHLRVAVLLDKVERRIADVKADYTGFVIPNEFVVGYGLDFDERYRNLPDVCVVRLGPRGKTKIEV